MTAVNHALTGAVIGLAIGQPALALPIALVSHYVCDFIPHYRSAMPQKRLLQSNGFRNYLIAEFCLCVSLVIVLAVIRPEHWLLAAICAFVAAAPDLLSIDRYLKTRHNKKWQPTLYNKFAGGIQWFERPIGAVVEVAWFVAAVAYMTPFLR